MGSTKGCINVHKERGPCLHFIVLLSLGLMILPLPSFSFFHLLCMGLCLLNYYLYTKMHRIFTVCWSLCNLFCFQFGPQTLFLGDQVLFKEQLVLNSYEIVGLEEGGPK